jgi:predicted transposase/invertase (TIGR01784 family)
MHLLRCGSLYYEGSLPEVLQNEEGVEQAVRRMREALGDPELQNLLRARERATRDEASRIYNAKAEGLVEGEARGLVEGEARGLVKGEARGRAEERSVLARNLLMAGFEPEQVAQLFGLSLESVRNLQDT